MPCDEYDSSTEEKKADGNDKTAWLLWKRISKRENTNTILKTVLTTVYNDLALLYFWHKSMMRVRVFSDSGGKIPAFISWNEKWSILARNPQ